MLQSYQKINLLSKIITSHKNRCFKCNHKKIKLNLINNLHSYPSKLLLLGEYTVTQGSSALAVPLNIYAGQWAINNKNELSSKGLWHLFNYLLSTEKGRLLFNLDSFKNDLETGWYFSSDIPSGYGLGSSGAVVAAVYEAYAKSKTHKLVDLIEILSFMENAFHGNSSGIDPMVSYLNSSVVYKNNSQIEKVKFDFRAYNFFLIDSGISRSTSTLVEVFKQNIIHKVGFKNALKKLQKANEYAIESCLSSDSQHIFQSFYNISHLQLENFQEMILPDWSGIWLEGLLSGDYYLKLCGAGGGGMLLGMYKEGVNLQEKFPHYKLIEF